MKHSIISWDCSYRNFFHLIDSLNEQDYDKSEFEIIYIEQRDQKTADQYNHSLGLKALSDKAKEYRDKINIKVFYLNDNSPYHLGKSNNRGISEATGEIISVMDGDTLIPKDFLKKMDIAHKSNSKVLNLHRHMSRYPVGISKFHYWKEAIIDIEMCLNATDTKNNNLGKNCANKGPMISARKKYWKKIEGYDESSIWCTSASTSGMDVNKRLEIATNSQSEALNSFCVHPWHPAGYAEKNRSLIKFENLAKEFVKQQRRLTQWSSDENKYSLASRNQILADVMEESKDLINNVIFEEQKFSSLPPLIPNVNIKKVQKRVRLNRTLKKIHPRLSQLYMMTQNYYS